MDPTIPRTARPPSRDAKAKAPLRIPEELDPVSDLIKTVYPGCPFMVVVWTPKRHEKTVVEMITNCDLDKVAGVLRETAAHMEQTSDLEKLPPAPGRA